MNVSHLNKSFLTSVTPVTPTTLKNTHLNVHKLVTWKEASGLKCKKQKPKHVCLKFYEVTKYRQLLCFLELIINIHISTYGGYIKYILYTNMSLLLPLIVSLPWDLCSCPGIVAWYNKDGVESQNKNESTSTWPFPRQNLSVRENEGERELWPPACSQAAGTMLCTTARLVQVCLQCAFRLLSQTLSYYQ